MLPKRVKQGQMCRGWLQWRTPCAWVNAKVAGKSRKFSCQRNIYQNQQTPFCSRLGLPSRALVTRLENLPESFLIGLCRLRAPRSFPCPLLEGDVRTLAGAGNYRFALHMQCSCSGQCRLVHHPLRFLSFTAHQDFLCCVFLIDLVIFSYIAMSLFHIHTKSLISPVCLFFPSSVILRPIGNFLLFYSAVFFVLACLFPATFSKIFSCLSYIGFHLCIQLHSYIQLSFLYSASLFAVYLATYLAPYLAHIFGSHIWPMYLAHVFGPCI